MKAFAVALLGLAVELHFEVVFLHVLARNLLLQLLPLAMEVVLLGVDALLALFLQAQNELVLLLQHAGILRLLIQNVLLKLLDLCF